MASNANHKEENGHSHHGQNETIQTQPTSWIGKKAAKTRSSPRPASTAGLGSAKMSSSTPVHHHRHHNESAAMNSTNNTTTPLVKPQSWSETNVESPVNNRLRIRDKLRPVSAAMAGKLRQQRERRRTKRRGPYMPSTEGTSTGDEDGELFQMDNVRNAETPVAAPENKSRHRNSLYQHGENSTKAPPTTSASRRFSSPTMRRLSKSPSDLDADDEDNEDYDSASMVSATEILQARARAIQNTSGVDDDAVFNAQFQEIRMAGMQQLAEIDGSTGLTSVGGSLVESASSSVEEQVGKILEKERREKTVLIQELGQKEQRIYEMEKIVVELNRRLLDTGIENEHLKAENRALLQTMAKLSAAE